MLVLHQHDSINEISRVLEGYVIDLYKKTNIKMLNKLRWIYTMQLNYNYYSRKKELMRLKSYHSGLFVI
jgi:hypothetical protein